MSGNTPLAAVVATVTVACAAVLPAKFTVAGFSAHVTALGVPLHVTATAPVNEVGDNVTVYVAVWPAITVAEVLADDNAKFEPMPLRFTVCVAGVASSAIIRVAVCVPAAIGAKLTGIVHLAPAARLLPHVELSIGNSLASDPAMVMPPIVSDALPVLVNVIVCAALVVFTT
jgi:hypothetical protein